MNQQNGLVAPTPETTESTNVSPTSLPTPSSAPVLEEAEQRLRQAARILANGAIRAAQQRRKESALRQSNHGGEGRKDDNVQDRDV